MRALTQELQQRRRSPALCLHRLRTSLSPSSTLRSIPVGKAARRSVSRALSTVKSWETLMTESLGSFVSLVRHKTLPGASASRRFDVMAATITVCIRLSLNAFACTIRTGRLWPGPEPVGSGRVAHHTSPRRTTILPLGGKVLGVPPEPDQDASLLSYRWRTRFLSLLYY